MSGEPIGDGSVVRALRTWDVADGPVGALAAAWEAGEPGDVAAALAEMRRRRGLLRAPANRAAADALIAWLEPRADAPGPQRLR